MVRIPPWAKLFTEFDLRKNSVISWLLSLQHLISRWVSPDREYEAENEFSEATAVFIDYSRSDCYCNHLSALQNNSFFGLSPFLTATSFAIEVL